ncbi:glycosyltransferase [Citrus sinensis]|uniref:Glycosyltransferase n=2 Tax=Citrus sinensis TaxID=2711 RepID=A0ACB8IPV0_CITSI|nr:glycosyltransferase [Citrus sinensis]
MYDLFQPWAAEAAYQYHIAAVLFLTISAVAGSYLLHNIINPSLKYPFFESDFLDRENKKINRFMHPTANGTLNKDRNLKAFELSCKFVFIKTSREIESKYLDYFPSLMENEIVPVGPLVQESIFKEDDTKIMDWLSQKEPWSVVFVSFGSEYFLSKDEMHEIASGLLLSEVSFIRVLRLHPDEKITIEEALPQGFAEEIERNNKGMLVQGWVPQAKILRHGRIGGFLSHCGWGSAVEGMVFGVPIIAMPMVYEQSRNAKVVVDIGMGMDVPRDKINQRLRREEVARVIKHVLLQEEGKQIRRKAKEMSERMRR